MRRQKAGNAACEGPPPLAPRDQRQLVGRKGETPIVKLGARCVCTHTVLSHERRVSSVHTPAHPHPAGISLTVELIDGGTVAAAIGVILVPPCCGAGEAATGRRHEHAHRTSGRTGALQQPGLRSPRPQQSGRRTTDA